MSDLTLTAGVARVDITPPVGFRMQGAMRRTEGSVGIESPLLATALILADEQTKVVIMDCDLIGFDLPLAERIRQTVCDRVNTPRSHVTIGCTHTHNGPCTVRGSLGGVHDVGGAPAERKALNAYIETLVSQLAGVADVADSRCRPARTAAGRGTAPVAINREELNNDGHILVGRNPEGTTDHSVDVLRVDDLEGNPIAVLTSFAAHPVVMGYHTYLLSPDYPGVVRRIVEQVTGATCLFLTGAAGNQASLSFLQNDWGEQERMGGLIGAEATRVFFDIETRPHEVVREVDVSLSNIALYHKEFHDGPTHSLLKAAHRDVSVPLQPLPSSEDAEVALAEASDRVQKLEDEDAPATKIYPARLFERWAEGVAEKVRAGLTQQSLSFEIVGYRLDDFVLVSMPGEPFVEIGLGVKRRSKAQHTMFAGYSNGVLAYWPTDQTIAHGGMAVEASIKSYNIPAPPASGTVDRIVNAFGALLNALDL